MNGTNMVVQLQDRVSRDSYLRSRIRREAYCEPGRALGCRLPVHVIGGIQAPRIMGEPGYHTTPGGQTIVRHPNAYGWRTECHCSTERIEVGWWWLARRLRMVGKNS